MPLLDVLRGVAILGTLATNIWIFTSAGSEGVLLTGNPVGSGDDPLQTVFMFLANGKFISMLTFMFGVGLAIQYQSAAKRGRRWPGRYHWRALFLFVEGTVHFILIFAFDVLMGYAVTAIIVAWLLTRSQTTQRVVMWVHLGLHLAFMALLTLGISSGAAGEGPQGAGPEVEAIYADGSWLDQVDFRLANWPIFRLETVIAFPMMMFLFLLGVRLFRAGAFGGDEHGRRIRERMLLWGMGLGLPLNLALQFAPEQLVFVERYVAAPFLAFGYIGLVGWIVDHFTAKTGRQGPLMNGLSSLGRAALSGYILQNLVASAVCYGWGLGLAARFGESAWFGASLWLAISAVLIVGSRLWLTRFAAGPAEMLQKKLIR
ncbi:DUF418 domain-containing protein [Glycomyces tenuis]|uniref:DUF418 domain-containing protein n=1 Tax=Glycomyces tenuis TaxID=58116 RepID=UPI00055007B1